MPTVPDTLHIHREPIEQVCKSAVHCKITAEECAGFFDNMKIFTTFAKGAADTAAFELRDLRARREQTVRYPDYPVGSFSPQDVPHVGGIDMVAVENLLGIKLIGFQDRFNRSAAVERFVGTTRRAVCKVNEVLKTSPDCFFNLLTGCITVSGTYHDAFVGEIFN